MFDSLNDCCDIWEVHRNLFQQNGHIGDMQIASCRKLPPATAYSIRYQETVLLTPHQEYCQFNQHRTTSTNAYKQYITVRLKLISHIFDLKSICLQQTYVLIKRTTGHL